MTKKTYAGAVVVNDPLFRFENPGQGISGFGGVEWKFQKNRACRTHPNAGTLP